MSRLKPVMQSPPEVGSSASPISLGEATSLKLTVKSFTLIMGLVIGGTLWMSAQTYTAKQTEARLASLESKVASIDSKVNTLLTRTQGLASLGISLPPDSSLQ